MEAHGYVERVRERVDGGRVVTRTYAYNAPALTRARGVVGEGPVAVAAPVAVPVAASVDPVPVRPMAEVEPVEDVSVEEELVEGDSGAVDPVVPPAADPVVPPVAEAAVAESSESGEHHDKAVALLVGLRRTDDRFTLSQKDVSRLTPAVIAWFDNGAGRTAVHHAMTADVPVPLKNPARFLAYRLRELLPPPLPVLPGVSEGWAVEGEPALAYRMVDCAGGCNRAFRRPEGTWCRDCRADRDRRTAGAVGRQDPNPSVPPEPPELDAGRTDPPGFPRSAA